MLCIRSSWTVELLLFSCLSSDCYARIIRPYAVLQELVSPLLQPQQHLAQPPLPLARVLLSGPLLLLLLHPLHLPRVVSELLPSGPQLPLGALPPPKAQVTFLTCNDLTSTNLGQGSAFLAQILFLVTLRFYQ